MKIFSKVKNGLIGFTKWLSEPDIEDDIDLDKVLPPELKAGLAYSDGLANQIVNMSKKPKSINSKFRARLDNMEKVSIVKEQTSRNIKKTRDIEQEPEKDI